MTNVSFRPWGLLPTASSRLADRRWESEPLPADDGRTMLPFGFGRSYGDVCLNDDGWSLSTEHCDRLLAFDDATGILACEAGASLGEILRFSTSRGWFLPVAPGTKHVTVGGAIANDVHGKNHVHVGAFGRYVLGFTLIRSEGPVRCSRTEHPELFAATIGGLGLTGLITEVQLQLQSCPGPAMRVREWACGSAMECWRALGEAFQEDAYGAAWLDCLSGGSAFGRGVLSVASHCSSEEDPAPQRERSLGRFVPPVLLNRWTMTAFSALWVATHRGPRTRVAHYEHFLFQLDAVSDWNLLYRPRGLLQYQSVFDPAGIEPMLEVIRRSSLRPYFVTLKKLGDLPSPGMLSWPKAGACLAFDLPWERGAVELCHALDEVTLRFGGRVYPAKDPRVPRSAFARMFPQVTEFARFVDPRFSSNFWRRVAPASPA